MGSGGALEALTSLVADWARRDALGGAVLYVVPGPRVRVERLWSRWLELREGVAAELGAAVALVPVSTIPLTDAGEVDWPSLEALAIVDPELARACEHQLGERARRVAVEIEAAPGRAEARPASALVVGGWAGPSVEPSAGRSAEPPASIARPALSEGEPLVVEPGAAQTLIAALERAATGEGEFVDVDVDGRERRRSYAALIEDAERVLAGLRAAGLGPGDRVLLQLDDGDAYWTAFWACVLGGIVAVPVSIAPGYAQPGMILAKLRGAWAMLGRPPILADAGLLEPVRGLERLLDMPGLVVHGLDELRAAAGNVETIEHHEAAAADVAVLLLTSGSTGVPKLVPLSHANMLAMARGTIQQNGFGPADVTLNWMPLDHVGAIVFLGVMAVELGATQVHVAKELILRDPVRWLELIEAHRASISWAPNFAFGLIAERGDEVRARAPKLASMRFLVNAGEANVVETIVEFLRLLEPLGLAPGALRPAFGMSETCSGITWSAGFDPTRAAAKHVELGRPIPGASVRIVDGEGRVVDEGVSGRLEVRGPSVFGGYLDNPSANAEAFADGWFSTGDLGLLDDGRLVITGRQKEDIIIRGVNYYPHEIEAVVEELDEVARSFTAATAVRPDGSEGEELAIFFSPARALADDRRKRALCRRIRGAVARKTGIAPRYVIPVERDEVPKTAIGKIQRTRLRQRLEAGEFEGRIDDDGRRIPPWFHERVWVRRRPSADALGEDVARVVVASSEALATGWGPGTVVVTDHREILEAITKTRPPELVVELGPELAPETAAELEAAAAAALAPVLAVVHAWQALGADEPGSLRVVTRSGALVHGLIPGLVASVGHELPTLRCQHVEVDAASTRAEVLRRELSLALREPAVALRGGERWVPRLRALSFEAPVERQWVAGGCYLVTGGAGGIGRLLVRELVRRHGARVLVIGRRELELELEGARYAAIDVCDGPAVEQAVAEAEAAWGRPLDGIVHLAGQVRERALSDETPAAMIADQRAKLAGTLALDRVAAARPGCLFVHVSSVLGLFGSPGFAAYAAAASFQAEFAARQRAAGMRAVCLAFSRWDEIGIGRGQSREGARARGFFSLADEQGLLSLDAALGSGEPSVLIGVDGHGTELGIPAVGPARALLRLHAYLEGEEAPVAGLVDRRGAALEVAATWMPSLPTLESGEIDRASLRQSSDARTAPRTELEAELARIWTELLELDELGVDDSFFELGGSSLIAASLVARIREQLGVELAMSELFAAPTVAGIAAVLEASAAAEALPAIEPVARDGAHELSFAQARLWMLHHIEGEGAAYNEVHVMRLVGPVDLGLLEDALGRVCARHEILRTRFVLGPGGPLQEILAEPRIDLRVESLAGGEALLERRLAAIADEPFDLASPPLWRVAVLELGGDERILELVIHHIATDGWSIAILMREWSAAYAALAEGREPELDPVPFQYLDFSVWQRAWLADGIAEAQLEHWRERLAGAPALLELPTDRPRPAISSHRGGCERVELGPELSSAVRALAEASGATPFMVLMVAFVIVLARHAGQRDVVVGVPIANRRRREFEAIMGCFVNTLALRVELSEDASVGELVARVRAAALDAYAHQDLPFERLVEALAPDRSLGHNPLVQVNFDFQDAPLPVLELANVAASVRPPTAPRARVDVELHLWRDGGAIEGYLSFARDLFVDATAERLAGSFVEVVRELVADAERPLRAISGLAAGEAELLGKIGAGPIVARTPACIHDRFAAIAADHGEAPAVAFGGALTSYAELQGRVNQCARYLRGLGVGPGVAVAVFMPRSLDMVVAVLAILEAGGVYLPLDPQVPLARLHAILTIAMPPVVLTTDALEGELPSFYGQVVCLDGEWDAIASQARERPEPCVTPADDAYIIFTSGSTGEPKGTVLAHDGFVNMIEAQIAAFETGPGDRVAQFASCGFDASLSELFMALAAGACVVPVPAEVQLDPEAFASFVAAEGITVITLPPSYLRSLARAPLESLRVLISAGEAAGPEELRHYSRAGARRLRCFNAYGPTEASVCASLFLVDPERAYPWGVPIGAAIANTEIVLLDGDRLAPLGAIAEICLAGVGLARRYLGREDLTAAKFVEHPLRPGARIYRTGDLGRWTADGELLFVGRVDDEVKIRGHRVNAVEVERAIAEHPRVSDCRVIARTGTDGELELIAYYTEQPGVGLWPSVAEFFVYDDLLYHAMASHEARNRRYLAAFRERLAGKTVVEIGPGAEVILARLCVEAGAAKVYCIELLRETYAKAKAKIAELGLGDRIVLIHGDALEVELPETVDWCVSEIVGSIGGSEGAARIINGARRFVHEPSHMLPTRSLTRIAAVSLPSGAELGFSETAAHYVERIFEDKGYRFDLRLCIEGLGRDDLISTIDVFEDLDYTRPIALAHTHAIELTMTRAGRVHGLLVWLVLCVSDEHVIDSLDSQESWLPILLPISRAGIEVGEGDRFVAEIERRPCANGLNPDYEIRGRLVRTDGRVEVLELSSPHDLRRYRATPFYEQLWGPDDEVPLRAPLTAEGLRKSLAERLPRYMLPAQFVALPELPLAANGKVDRAALPEPERDVRVVYHAPRDETEAFLAEVWAEILGLERVDVRDNFFDLGGHSLRLVRVRQRIVARYGPVISVVEMFQYATIEALAAELVARTAAAEAPGAREPEPAPKPKPEPQKSSRAEALARQRRARQTHRSRSKEKP